MIHFMGSFMLVVHTSSPLQFVDQSASHWGAVGDPLCYTRISILHVYGISSSLGWLASTLAFRNTGSSV